MDDTAAQEIPAIIVVFGATGDLARRKIFPSLSHLFRHRRLPARLSVIGFGRQELSDDVFRDRVREAIGHGGAGEAGADMRRFAELFTYHRGAFEERARFSALAEKIHTTESSWGVCANKLFYFAVPSSSYPPIFQNLAAAKLNLPCGGELGWSRVLIEKPFGADAASAHALQSLLSSCFKEEQIYRIDHYLFKEIIQGIEYFRFSNNLFEHTWDNTTVDRIDIRLLESIGVEERGAFYDAVGALRDVGQNHLLAMLAAITMEYPAALDADSMRDHRAGILEALAPWTEGALRTDTYRAQYDGYRRIKDVAPDSAAETYFALKTGLVHPKWRGVPIFMEAGKRTGKAVKEITVTLKHPTACLLCETGAHGPNTITFRLEPNDEIIIRFWTKKPGFGRVLEERSLSFFLYERTAKQQYVEEYSKVLHAAIAGDQTLFVGPREIDAMWQFTDPVVDAWRRGAVPLAAYAPDTRPFPALLTTQTDVHASVRAEVGIIGLGKMGANVARRLHERGWRVVGFNHSPEKTRALEAEGIVGAYSPADMARSLIAPRVILVMVPHTAVDDVLAQLIPFLEKGDTVIDGGNSPYKESMRRAAELAQKGIHVLDAGISGGPEGARHGACVMVGGQRDVFEKAERLFGDMTVPDGYRYMGTSGAGHFVKMVHNGIEYGMMESIAEGFTIMRHSAFALKLLDVAGIYQRQSVVTSRLVGWLHQGFEKYGEDLAGVSGTPGATGEGQWTIDAAQELGVEAANIAHALDARVESQKHPGYAGKLIQTMRIMFGGHTESTTIRSYIP